ncbi:DndE family protein [Dryocola sp. BD586]|uniref:DndE family protein n=1 Tax=Dryocola sp. BD586 TaxID=3133271 RepID=UPI003F50579E
MKIGMCFVVGALCLSLAEKSLPPHEDIITDSSVEMTWKTFGGEHSEIYTAVLRQRFYKDYGKNTNFNYYFKLHLHRGISYLLNKVDNIEDIFSL